MTGRITVFSLDIKPWSRHYSESRSGSLRAAAACFLFRVLARFFFDWWRIVDPIVWRLWGERGRGWRCRWWHRFLLVPSIAARYHRRTGSFWCDLVPCSFFCCFFDLAQQSNEPRSCHPVDEYHRLGLSVDKEFQNLLPLSLLPRK